MDMLQGQLRNFFVSGTNPASAQFSLKPGKAGILISCNVDFFQIDAAGGRRISLVLAAPDDFLSPAAVASYSTAIPLTVAAGPGTFRYSYLPGVSRETAFTATGIAPFYNIVNGIPNNFLFVSIQAVDVLTVNINDFVGLSGQYLEL